MDNYDAVIQYKKPIDSDRINIALVGVGAFARTVQFLPNLVKLKDKYHLSGFSQ